MAGWFGNILGIVLGAAYSLFIVVMFALQIPTNVARASSGDMLLAILAAAVMVFVICGIPLLALRPFSVYNGRRPASSRRLA